MNGKRAKALRNLAIGSDETTYKEKIYKKVMKTLAGAEIKYTVKTNTLNRNTKRADYKLLKKAHYAGELYI